MLFAFLNQHLVFAKQLKISQIGWRVSANKTSKELDNNLDCQEKTKVFSSIILPMRCWCVNICVSTANVCKTLSIMLKNHNFSVVVFLLKR